MPNTPLFMPIMKSGYFKETFLFHGRILLSKGGIKLVTTILIISVIIIAVVLLLSLTVTSKAYQYKHTIDPPPEVHPSDDQDKQEKDI
jgi:hypothetical protein